MDRCRCGKQTKYFKNLQPGDADGLWKCNPDCEKPQETSDAASKTDLSQEQPKGQAETTKSTKKKKSTRKKKTSSRKKAGSKKDGGKQ